MRLIVNGETYFARFAHKEVKRHHVTECRIERDVPEGFHTLLGEGVARCSRLDQFSKKEGRILAMTRALANAPTLCGNKELRAQLWQAYFAISKKP